MAKKDPIAREQAQLLGLGRAGIGAALFLLPGFSSRVWLGQPARGASARVAMRALGVRELILGLGALMALDGRGSPAAWIEAGALCDMADTYLMATSRGVPMSRRIPFIALAAGAAYAGTRVADELD